jgi:hypothetical protein
MPIRSAPFEAIDEAIIDSMKERRIRENRTLDFKRDLDLFNRDLCSEFLKDVTAFANGSGGILLYGAEEGKGEDEGVIAALPGLELEPDATHSKIDNLLRDAVDERPMGVLHRAIPRADGRYYYVVRVPPSPLAPHMVTIGKHSSKFFLRANTTTSAMDTRQIKETVLKAASAYDRALEIIEDRRRVLITRANRYLEEGGPRDHPTDRVRQAMLHVVPLFPGTGGFALSDERVVERLTKVSIFGWPLDNYLRRFALDGLYVSYGEYARAAYLRSGAAEYQEYILGSEPAYWTAGGSAARATIPAWKIEQGVLQTLDDCAGLTADGLLPLPLAVSLSLTGVEGRRLQGSPKMSSQSSEIMDVDEVSMTAILIHGWDQVAAEQVRSVFDEMYQGWGFRRSRNYEGDKRIWWGDHDRNRAPFPSYWTSGWTGGI